MPQTPYSPQRLTARTGHPERINRQGFRGLGPARVRAPGGPHSKLHPLTKRSSRKCGIVCLAAALLSLIVAADTVFGEEPAEIKKPEKIVATDYASLQQAIDAAKRLKVRHLYMPPGIYDIDKTLNLTDDFGYNLILEGAGWSTVLNAKTADTPAIDLTNSRYMVLKNFSLQGNASIGMLMARKGPGQWPQQSPPSSGNHEFHNVQVHGFFKKACALSYDAETNFYYSCVFSNRADGGDGFVITDYNREGAKSPHWELGDSTNTSFYFYGTAFRAQGNGSVGLRISGASSVFTIGGFVCSEDSFAGIYLDGTGHAGQITIRDVHMEGSARHNLYAVGAVRNILIEGGHWGCGAEAANIRHQEGVPAGEKAHQHVAFPKARGRAVNWNIRNLLLVRAGAADPTSPRIRFDSLQDSRFTNINYHVSVDRSGGEIKTLVPHIAVEKYSRRNSFEVPSREAVELRGDAKANRIVALVDDSEDRIPALWQSGWTNAPGNEVRGLGLHRSARQKYYDGTRRTYVKPDAGLSLLNLGLVNVFKIATSRKGDFVLHDGTGFKDGEPRLAVFSGNKWLFFDITAAPKPK